MGQLPMPDLVDDLAGLGVAPVIALVGLEARQRPQGPLGERGMHDHVLE